VCIDCLVWSLAMQIEGVAALPVGASGATDRLRVVVSLAQTTRLATGARLATQLTMLVHRVDDPLRLGVVANRLVGRVDEDDFVVLMRSILTHPVRVQHTQSWASTTDPLLSQCLQIP